METIFANTFSFWNQLTDSEKDAILQGYRIRTFEKGFVVHRSDMGCQGAIIVQKGVLRVYIVSDEGREVTLFRIRAGECCVLSASCLLDSIQFDIMIEATQESEAVIVPTAILHPIKEKNPYVEAYLYKQATERFSDVMWTMQQILFMGADKRVAHFLWDELLVQDAKILVMTHDEIAKNIGSAREVITKVLKYFAEEGIVALSRGKIQILDKEKLKTYL